MDKSLRKKEKRKRGIEKLIESLIENLYWISSILRKEFFSKFKLIKSYLKPTIS